MSFARHLSVLFLSSFLISCASALASPTPPIGKASSEYLVFPKYLRHCQKLPLGYIIDSTVPDKYHDVIDESFQMWNMVMKKKFFVKKSPAAALGARNVIIVAIDSDGRHVVESKSYAVMSYNYNKKMCFTSSNIFIAEKTLERSNELVQSVLRHEIGHALGLGHGSKDGHLMSPTISSGINAALRPTSRDIRLVYEIYKGQYTNEENKNFKKSYKKTVPKKQKRGCRTGPSSECGNTKSTHP